MTVDYILGPINVEDLFRVPGTDWVVTSSMTLGVGSDVAPGRLYLIDTRTKAFQAIAPAQIADRRDAGENRNSGWSIAELAPHGISIRPSADGRHTLYVVNHGGRESVEIFELDARGAVPAVAWTGSAVLPEGAWGNAVSPLPDGGFVVSKMFDPRDMGQVLKDFAAGAVTGHVLEWRPGGEWRVIAGSELCAPNGLLASEDGAWIYVASWGGEYVMRLPRVAGGGEPVKVPLGFLVDNLRFAPDGSILAAGQAAPLMQVFAADSHDQHDVPSAVARIDPQTMASEIILRHGPAPEFGHGTTALVVGDELWLGTVRGDRIACFPLPAALRAASAN